jgi:HSP90 family molecular chaperone
MEKNLKMSLSSRDGHGLSARDPEEEPDLANQAEWRFQQVVQSYTSHIASPVYLMEVVDKARSAAQYRKDSDGLKDSLSVVRAWSHRA